MTWFDLIKDGTYPELHSKWEVEVKKDGRPVRLHTSETAEGIEELTTHDMISDLVNLKRGSEITYTIKRHGKFPGTQDME
jgi:hypothetical protein|tara:strand:+ start:909 stop:1148 length:240 start_codon:yes stop_codon:yes gene_type:complete